MNLFYWLAEKCASVLFMLAAGYMQVIWVLGNLKPIYLMNESPLMACVYGTPQ